MKRVGGTISFLVALVLLGTALTNWVNDSRNAPDRISAEFADIGNQAAFDRDIQDLENARNSMALEAIAGAALLIGGFVLWSGKNKDKNTA
jgi:hypothetical protein